MKTIQRFTLHVLLPPLGGGILILGALGIANIGSASLSDALLFLGIGLLYAYGIALIPSIAYATVMEFAACWCGIAPGSRCALWLSAGLGFIVGSLPFISADAWRDWQTLIFIPAVGFVVGLTVEWLIGRLSERCCATPETTPWDSLRGHGW